MNSVIFRGSDAFATYSVNDYKNITCCFYRKCRNDHIVHNTTGADAFVPGSRKYMKIMNLWS